MLERMFLGLVLQLDRKQNLQNDQEQEHKEVEEKGLPTRVRVIHSSDSRKTNFGNLSKEKIIITNI